MGPLRIVVVSADEARAQPLVEALRAGGHQVEVEFAPSGAAAAVTRQPLDVVALDLRAPGIDSAALAAALAPSGSPSPPASLEAIERAHILLALRFTRGNKRRAAQLLGIARSTLIQKVRRYGIQKADVTGGDDAGD